MLQLYLIYRNKHREAAKKRRQRIIGQTEEQNKTPGKELNKMGTSNLLDAEFKTLVIRMLKELSEDLNSIKKTQAETLMEIKSNLQGINSRVDEAKNQTSNLEYKEANNNQSGQLEGKIIKKMKRV